MNQLQNTVQNMDTEQLDTLIHLVIKRFEQLNPNEQMNVVYLPKGPEAARLRVLRQIMDFLQSKNE